MPLARRAPAHSRSAPRRIASLLLAVACAAASGVAAPGVAGAAVPPTTALRAAVDPVGSYQWSLVMTAMNNEPVSGTMTVSRKDSALAATVTSDHADGEIAAKSVTFENNRLTVVVDGDFGEFTVYADYKDDGITGSFHFVDPQGGASDGPMTIKRAGTE